MSRGAGQLVCVGRVSEWKSPESRKVVVGDRAVVVVRIEEDFYALGDVCSHANFSLSEGDIYVDDLEIECWKHGSTFSLVTGKPQCLPATKPVAVYDVTVDDGQVWIEVRS
ncbi:MAG: non-heme iron oxygenase ferredoxin subunit [Acidimicrobiales bacterium]